MYQIKEGDKEGIIFLEKDEVFEDTDTMKQIHAMITDPSVDHPRIMPDCHYGNGCCVGFTSKLTECTVPRYIGGDIGCGMTMYPLPERVAKKINKDPERYHDLIVSVVPVGAEKRTMPLTRDLKPLLNRLDDTYDEAWAACCIERIGMDKDKIYKQLGTLGSGNHFIEVGEGETGQVYITVHSGSRALGQAVCRHHQDIITQGTKKDWNSYNRERDIHNKKCKDKTRRVVFDAELKEKYLTDKHLRYLEGDESRQYFHDMVFAQEYASYNRYLMLNEIIYAFGMDKITLDDSQIIESVHNYIDFDDKIWRKGAIRADKDQLIIIALNMRDGILLAKGKGNENWNNSAPHGAGRKIPRNQARCHSNLKEFKAQMRDVYSKSVRSETLDESPSMYKKMELIKDRAKDTCEIIDHIKPLINIKGWDSQKTK